MASQIVNAEIRTRSARLRRLLTGLSVGLWGLLILERFSAAGIDLFSHGMDTEAVKRLTYEFVIALPQIFYLLSLWWIRQALASFAQGELYGPTIIRMLNRVGIMLAAGTLTNVFLVPVLSRGLGYSPGYWVAFDVAGLVLGAVGLALTVIARVLQGAAQTQAELDEIF